MIWEPDPLLSGYNYARIELPDVDREDIEPVGTLPTASLIRRQPTGRRRVVCYLHGWADYFFQTHLADVCASMGFDFYALELRRYGRGWQPGQLAGYVADLADYDLELNLAMEYLRTQYDDIVLMGHSTGGLVAAGWAQRHPGIAAALVLNSPWLDAHGSPMLRRAVQRVLATGAQLAPTRAIPVPEIDHYERAMHSSREGEWNYDRDLKGGVGFGIWMGWLHAVLRMQADLARGWSIDAPILVCTSDHSAFGWRFREDFKYADIVLDVDSINLRAPNLGDEVTLVKIRRGTHDLALSRQPARDRYFSAVATFLQRSGLVDGSAVVGLT